MGRSSLRSRLMVGCRVLISIASRTLRLNQPCIEHPKRLRKVSNVWNDSYVLPSFPQELFKVHTGFQSDLSRACNPASASKNTIAGCFIKWKEKFLIYGEFCSNLPDAQDLVDEVGRKDPAVELALKVGLG